MYIVAGRGRRIHDWAGGAGLGLFCKIHFGGGLRRVGAPAGGLDALELVEGAVEGALDAGLVAAEGVEDAGRGTGVPAEDVGEFVFVGKADVAVFEVPLAVDEAEIEEAGFDGAAAGEAPLGHDDLVDEGGFEGAGGLEVIEEGVEEFVEGLVVFAADDGVIGSEAVFEGIGADGGLALGGFGAGAVLGVAAIGGDLFVGGHWFVRLLTRKDGASGPAPSRVADELAAAVVGDCRRVVESAG